MFQLFNAKAAEAPSSAKVKGAGFFMLENPDFILGTDREIKNQPDDGSFFLPLNLIAEAKDGTKVKMSTLISINPKEEVAISKTGKSFYVDANLATFWATDEQLADAQKRKVVFSPRKVVKGEEQFIEIVAAYMGVPYAVNSINDKLELDKKFDGCTKGVISGYNPTSLDSIMKFCRTIEAKKAGSDFAGTPVAIAGATNNDGNIDKYSLMRGCDSKSVRRVSERIKRNSLPFKFGTFVIKEDNDVTIETPNFDMTQPSEDLGF